MITNYSIQHRFRVCFMLLSILLYDPTRPKCPAWLLCAGWHAGYHNRSCREGLFIAVTPPSAIADPTLSQAFVLLNFT